MMEKTLTHMVEQALARWPEIAYTSKRGNRAQSAAALVQTEQVRHIAGDRWEVNDYACTATACECEDRAPLDEHGAKLCKHCIAVRMTIRLQDNRALIDRLAALGDGRDVVRLIVERDYDNRVRTLTGYREHGRDVRLPATERVVVTYEQMRWALEVLGWSLDGLPVKWVRYEYLFTLRTNATGTSLTQPLWALKGVTDVMIERRSNERLAGWFTQEVAAMAA